MQTHELVKGAQGPVILWCMYPHRQGQLEAVRDAAEKAAGADVTRLARARFLAI